MNTLLACFGKKLIHPKFMIHNTQGCSANPAIKVTDYGLLICPNQLSRTYFDTLVSGGDLRGLRLSGASRMFIIVRPDGNILIRQFIKVSAGGFIEVESIHIPETGFKIGWSHKDNILGNINANLAISKTPTEAIEAHLDILPDFGKEHYAVTPVSVLAARAKGKDKLLPAVKAFNKK